MTPRAFFPDPTTGTVFFFLLLGGLAVAAYVDYKTFRIPKWITLTLLAAGLIVNIARGAWLGSEAKRVWLLDAGPWWLGAVDGLLFSLAGFATAFAIYFLMWMLRTVKGGDVKLCAAIGAWLGPFNMVLFVLASVAALFVCTLARLFLGGFRLQESVKRAKQIRQGGGMRNEAEVQKFARRGMTFSLPAALAAAAVMMWSFRYDLQLVPPKPTPDHGSAHAPVQTAQR